MKSRASTLMLLAAMALAACATPLPKSTRKPAPLPSYTAQAEFQFGQNLTIKLDKSTGNSGLQRAVQGWIEQGVYTNTPVYRQLPGVFVLTGKPRLAGHGFVDGDLPSKSKPTQTKFPEAKAGHVGLIVHADGTVGPELIFIYGHSISACCEAPQNIRIGKIVKGKSSLKSVQRGDNLQSIAIQP